MRPEEEPPPPSEPPPDREIEEPESPHREEAPISMPSQPAVENNSPEIQKSATIPKSVDNNSQKEEQETHAHTRDVRRDWDEFTNYVKERKVWMAQDLQRSDSAKEVEGELHLHYSDPTICTLLRNKDNRKLLTEFVLDFFQKDLTVRFILPDQNGIGKDNGDPESPHKKRQQLSQDPLVQMAVEIFNGQVGDIRIGPRSR